MWICIRRPPDKHCSFSVYLWASLSMLRLSRSVHNAIRGASGMTHQTLNSNFEAVSLWGVTTWYIHMSCCPAMQGSSNVLFCLLLYIATGWWFYPGSLSSDTKRNLEARCHPSLPYFCGKSPRIGSTDSHNRWLWLGRLCPTCQAISMSKLTRFRKYTSRNLPNPIWLSKDCPCSNILQESCCPILSRLSCDTNACWTALMSSSAWLYMPELQKSFASAGNAIRAYLRSFNGPQQQNSAEGGDRVLGGNYKHQPSRLPSWKAEGKLHTF